MMHAELLALRPEKFSTYQSTGWGAINMSRTVESPVLNLDAVEQDYLDQTGRAWACHDVLSELFELDGARKICFFSTADETVETYRTELFHGLWNLLDKPVQ